MDKLTLILAIIAALGWLVALALYLKLLREGRENASDAGTWLAYAIAQQHKIDELRELVNRERRNTGKAEV